jgi:predicted O-methyltransferase YrrM
MVAFHTPADFREQVYGFQVSRIILTAYELGIFTVIGDIKKTSFEVASEIQTNERATDRLMNALVACELLGKEKGGFYNHDFAKKYLVKGKPDYLAGYDHTLNMWQTWSELTFAIKSGGPVQKNRQQDPERTTAFIAAMHDRAFKQAADVVALIHLEKINHILDVGGGSGAYSMAFVKAKNNLDAVIFDLPEVLPNTKKYIAEAGLTSRISMIAGNYHYNDMGQGYDLVFLSAIIHINSPEENQSLISRCVNTLNPGGMLVIQDHIMSEDRTYPRPGAFFALNMLVATEHGDTYTEKEITNWMKQAGLIDINIIPTFNNALVMGQKK